MKSGELTHLLTSKDSSVDTIICLASDLKGRSLQWKA